MQPGELVAVGITDDQVSIADAGGTTAHRTDDPVELLRRFDEAGPRWVWWSARETVAPWANAWRPRACWDLAAVARLLDGGHHDFAAAPNATDDMLDFGAPVVDRGPARAREIALEQLENLRALPDPRAQPGAVPLAVLTAYAESAAAVLAVELEHTGLPVDTTAMAAILRPVIGERPVDDAHAAATRRHRDDAVRRLFPHSDDVDLRNPAQVREMLARIGLDLPDTRSWRLQPHVDTSPAVRALVAWRKAERLATTYGWNWLDRDVGADGRLRGIWHAAEGAGRMTASAGLHNLPAELRPAVRADPGWVLVRADLGQVEPRVLATVSGDEALADAARQDDMYAPVAAALRCDRPTAKVAVLAAMYGQTSGTAGNALRDMDRAYPTAMAYLRAAEEAGRTGRDLRTYGGRLLPLHRALEDSRYPPMSWGRFARNAVVQGAAAELFKAWAATVRAGLAGTEGEIVLCLHDELLVHAPAETADAVADLMRTALAQTAHWWASGSGVRFVADIAIGASWADAH
ncbi:MAG: polymerase [Frankiaceae bacterium]|nr:polymerase [Frankiaceae bacterium]